MTRVLASAVVAALTLLGVGLLGRRGERVLAGLLAAMALLAPAAFDQGIRTWVEREAVAQTRVVTRALARSLVVVPTTTTTTVRLPPVRDGSD